MGQTAELPAENGRLGDAARAGSPIRPLEFGHLSAFGIQRRRRDIKIA